MLVHICKWGACLRVDVNNDGYCPKHTKEGRVESNPGTFGVSVRRVKPQPVEDTVEVKLTLGDARRLHFLLKEGWPDNKFNSIWGLKERLREQLERNDIFHSDLVGGGKE